MWKMRGGSRGKRKRIGLEGSPVQTLPDGTFGGKTRHETGKAMEIKQEAGETRNKGQKSNGTEKRMDSQQGTGGRKDGGGSELKKEVEIR